jgi:hypothetical protein
VEAEIKKAEREMERRKAEERRKGLVVTAKTRGRNVDPFDVLDTVSGREPGWCAGKMATQPQLDLLEKFGMRPSELEGMPMYKASRLIDSLMNRRRLGLCSFKQAKILKRNGYDPNATAGTASKIMAELKANGWRRPD